MATDPLTHEPGTELWFGNRADSTEEWVGPCYFKRTGLSKKGNLHYVVDLRGTEYMVRPENLVTSEERARMALLR